MKKFRNLTKHLSNLALEGIEYGHTLGDDGKQAKAKRTDELVIINHKEGLEDSDWKELKQNLKCFAIDARYYRFEYSESRKSA